MSSSGLHGHLHVHCTHKFMKKSMSTTTSYVDAQKIYRKSGIAICEIVKKESKMYTSIVTTPQITKIVATKHRKYLFS